MLIPFSDFLFRLDRLRAEVASACAACDRDPAAVAILPVTKGHPVEAVGYVARAGLPAVGENRVQEAGEKMAAGTALPVRWELIGHLQSNKARLAAGLFHRIQSVDSTRLLERLDRAAAEAGRRLAILLEINAGRDPAKFGCSLEEAPALLESALIRPHLAVEGLMTIAPLSDDPDVARRAFENLRGLRDELAGRFGIGLPELSMGMSDDWAVAVAAGSTQIRIGTALFGAREVPA
jgi:PLP dependent protein